MKKSGTCSKCGSTDIVADAKVVDRADMGIPFEMTLVTYRSPEAMVFRDKQETTVSAWVCAGCGYVEFYADKPTRIRLEKS